MHDTLPRHRRLLLALGAVGLVGACGGDANESGAGRDSLAGADSRELDAAEALRFMAAADQGEIQAAQLAARLATDREVRQFAQLMWREHSRSARDVADLARQMEIDLQASARAGPLVTSVRSMSQQTTQLLNGTPRGAGFDRAYVDAQVRMHQAVLQGLQRIAAGGGRGVGADVAPGAGVDVTMPGTPGVPAATTPAQLPTRPVRAASRARSRVAATPQEAARLAIARVQEHLAGARQLQARLGGGTG
jgi:predicted outer membrane protein